MGNPVLHFEIVGSDGKALQKFYADAFGWTIDANNPMDYGMVAAETGGIAGGITAGQDPQETRVTVYVAVPDLQAALDKVEKLGGKTLMPPMAVPGGPIIAMFADPAGKTTGLLKA